MFHRSSTIALLLPALLFLSACSKDKDDAATPSGGGGGTTSPLPGHRLEVWLSIFNGHDLPEIPSARCELLAPSGQRVPIDTIALNGTALSGNSSLSYYFPSTVPLDLTGVPGHWYIHIADSLPVMQTTVPATPYPSIGDLTSATSIPGGQPYTMSLTDLQDADSVTFFLGNFITRSFSGTPTSCSFTAAEIDQLDQNEPYHFISVLVWRKETRVVEGLPMHVTKSNMRTWLLEVL